MLTRCALYPFMSRYITKMVEGYAVRLPDQGKEKFFPAKAFNGLNFALLAAITWRDRQLKAIGQLHRLTASYHRKPKRTYPRGGLAPIIGVCFQIHEKKKGSITCGWAARFSVDKRQRTRFFSVDKYGHQRAFELACATRYHYCGTLMVKSRAPFKVKFPNEKCA